jgi:hypothetical protein
MSDEYQHRKDDKIEYTFYLFLSIRLFLLCFTLKRTFHEYLFIYSLFHRLRSQIDLKDSIAYTLLVGVGASGAVPRTLFYFVLFRALKLFTYLLLQRRVDISTRAWEYSLRHYLYLFVQALK